MPVFACFHIIEKIKLKRVATERLTIAWTNICFEFSYISLNCDSFKKKTVSLY